jgi:hypothetical protein
MFSKTHSPERMNKPFISKIDDQSTQCDQSDPSNAAPEWQAGVLHRKQRIDGGLSTRGAC